MSREGYMASRCLGRKIGMSKVFEGGKEIAVTICRIGKSELDRIVKVSPKENKFTALFSYAEKPIKTKKEVDIYSHDAANLSAVSAAFAENKGKVSADSGLAIYMDASSFRKGMAVSVSGITRGRGFEGGMKIWGFKGLEASHGVSLTHRSLGSTGQCQFPGKVFKGKKMAKRLGAVNVKIKGLTIVDVDLDLGVVAVKGAIPGGSGTPVIFEGDFSVN